MHYWVWGILQRWYACAPAAYEVVRNCRSFDIGADKEDLSELACRIPKLWNLPTKVHGAKTKITPFSCENLKSRLLLFSQVSDAGSCSETDKPSRHQHTQNLLKSVLMQHYFPKWPRHGSGG
jgi:hypothetical protein